MKESLGELSDMRCIIKMKEVGNKNNKKNKNGRRRIMGIKKGKKG
jgi:hypothetical protein